jgi:hypothetical protein
MDPSGKMPSTRVVAILLSLPQPAAAAPQRSQLIPFGWTAFPDVAGGASPYSVHGGKCLLHQLRTVPEMTLPLRLQPTQLRQANLITHLQLLLKQSAFRWEHRTKSGGQLVATGPEPGLGHEVGKALTGSNQAHCPT